MRATPPPYTVLFLAPFRDRSGFGSGARALVKRLVDAGVSVRVQCVGPRDEGIDDFDLSIIDRLESTQLVGTVVLLVYHVPSDHWLKLELPPRSIRAIITTSDGVWQGIPPTEEAVSACNAFDLVFLAEEEIPGWKNAGLARPEIHPIVVPHVWTDPSASSLIKSRSERPKTTQKKLRFLTIASYAPRRRWRDLFIGFLSAFDTDPEVELIVKANYPWWLADPEKPRNDLAVLLKSATGHVQSAAKIHLDDTLGTRQDLVSLIDSCNVFVSTDIAPTAPIYESLVRGLHVVVPESFHRIALPQDAITFIPERPGSFEAVTSDFKLYTPQYRYEKIQKLDPSDIAAALRSVVSEKEVRSPWKGHRKWMQSELSKDCIPNLVSAIEGILAKRSTKTLVSIEGPVTVDGSLASINRSIATHLIEDSSLLVTLVPTESELNLDALKKINPSLVPLVTKKSPSADIIIRHQWPPNFEKPSDGHLIYIQPWEFGGAPQAWVDGFNELADEVWVPSTWLRECYVDSGVDPTRVIVMPNGVGETFFAEHVDRFPLRTKKSFRFLFVGGTIYRKGIDLLLQAYLEEFSAADDVCLVIKGGQYRHYPKSELDSSIEGLQAEKRCAEVEFIDTSLSEQQMAMLFRSCHISVIPYRGEAFCLPLAESLCSGVPVIATADGGARDFMSPEWSYLVTGREVEITEQFLKNDPSRTPSIGGYWVYEPLLTELRSAMRTAFRERDILPNKGASGAAFVRNQLSWSSIGEKIRARLREIRKKPIQRLDSGYVSIICFPCDAIDTEEAILSFISMLESSENVVLILVCSKDSGTLVAGQALHDQFAVGARSNVAQSIFILDQASFSFTNFAPGVSLVVDKTFRSDSTTARHVRALFEKARRNYRRAKRSIGVG